MRKLATAAAVSLALASGGAFGLGLGEIEMQSALNQPMSAEIRLTSVKPGELDGMIVQLASPEAFTRAGIERSSALTGLSFSVDENSGTPVIRIESDRPVTEPFLNFLLEVDWPQGRMVREYTVLLDPPVFMSSNASERNISADQAAVIQGGESALVVPTPIDRGSIDPDAGFEVDLSALEDANPDDVLSLDEATSTNLSLSDDSLLTSETGISDGIGNRIALTDLGVSNTDAAQQRQNEALEAFNFDDIQVQVGGSVAEVSDDFVIGDGGGLDLGTPDDEGLSDEGGVVVSLDDLDEPAQIGVRTSLDQNVTVSDGDTLFEIASDTAPSGVSVQQMMLAILAANESSFIDNNINLVRAGAILRIPEVNEADRLTQAQALASISDQNQLWQDYRDSLRDTASTQVAQNIGTDSPVTPAVDETTPAADTADGINAGNDAVSETIETATLAPDNALDGLSDEARSILENARQEILDGEELRIVADSAPTNTVASATADETSDSSDTAALGEVNRRLQLAREELSASRLRTSDLSEQAEQLANTSENLESMVSLRQDEVARLESQLAEARIAADSVTDAPVQDVVDAATDTIADTTDAIATGADNAVDGVTSAADSALATAEDAINAGTDSIQTEVEGLVDNSSIDETAINNTIDGAADGETKTWYQGFLDDPKRMAIAGIGGLGLLGVLGTLLFRRKRKDNLDDTIFDTRADAPSLPDTGDVGKKSATAAAGVAAAGAAAVAGATEGHAHDDTLEHLDRTFAGAMDNLDDNSMTYEASEQSDLSMLDKDETASAIDKDDTISEVDVYLAYGLHGQAEELLTKAVERSPDNPEYVSKLLYTYHAQGNSDSFRATAADYHVRFGGDDNPEWSAIANMGAELDPTDNLYSAAALSTEALSDQGNREALGSDDFSSSLASSQEAGLIRDFDTSSAQTVDYTDDEASLMDSSLDPAAMFDEGDLEATGDFSAIADELAAEEASALADRGGINMPGFDDVGVAANESLKNAQVAGAAGIASASAVAAHHMDGLADSADDLTLDLDQLSGDLELDSAELLNADLADLDLPDLTADNELLLDSTGQFGTGADEMDTMLDLAKAYIDMGDKDSASSALGEIVKSGSPEQIDEAETLLRKIS